MRVARRPSLRSRRGLFRVAALGLGAVTVACGGGGGRSGPAGGAPDVSPAPPPPASRETPNPAEPRGTAVAVATPTGPPVCLVTKQHGLAPGYAPADLASLPPRVLASNGVRLRQAAAEAVVKLIDAAARERQTLFVLSGFRSYAEQERVLRDEIALEGREVAEKQVAPPGHSEHQLGEAADITSAASPYELSPQFGQEPEGRWLAANAPRFGFVISYPQGKEAVTGYTYEPWHIRHVGLPLAEQVAASGLTLTEFLPKHKMAGGCP